MTDLKITTVNNFDERGIFPRRTIRLDGTAVPTPTAATRCDKLQQQEEVHPESRGVCELYASVGGDDLDEALRSSSETTLEEKFRRQSYTVGADEIAVAFSTYDETATLPASHAIALTNIQSAYSDMLTVPMIPKLVRNVGADDDEEERDNPLADPKYRSFKKSVVTFLNAADERHPEMPVMGLLPRLAWPYLDDLMRIYESFGITAYVVDFDRRKSTTGAQVEVVEHLMGSLANRGIEDQVLMYAINPGPGTHDDGVGGRPAADIALTGLGFDVIGGRHVPPRMSKEAREKLEERNEESDEVEFRLFDKEEWLYRSVLLENLEAEFPAESSFDPERIVARVRTSPQACYRFQALVNSEQIGLAVAALRDELDAGDAQEALRTKLGVTLQVQDAFRGVRETFDAERFQSGLGDF